MRNAWLYFTILMVAPLLVFTGCAKDRGSLASGPKRFVSQTWDKVAFRKKQKSIGQGTMFRSEAERNQLMAKNRGDEPGRFKRAVAGVTDSKVARNVSSSVKRGTAKVANKFKSKSKAQPEQTVDALSLSTKPNQLDANFHLALARHQDHAGQKGIAEKQYQQALELEPYNLAGLMGYAHLLDRQDRYTEAIEQYRKAAKKHPEEAAIFNDLGLCYARQSQLVESLEALEKAVELQPERKLYRNNIATVLVELGRMDAALSHLQSVHGPAVAQYNIAYLLHEKGDNRRAADHFASALVADPSLTEAQEWLQRIEHEHPGAMPDQPTPKVAAHPQRVPSPQVANRSAPSGEQARSQGTAVAPRSPGSKIPFVPATAPAEQPRVSEQAPAGGTIQNRPGGPVDTPMPLQPDERALWPDSRLPSKNDANGASDAAPAQSPPVPSDLGAAVYR